MADFIQCSTKRWSYFCGPLLECGGKLQNPIGNGRMNQCLCLLLVPVVSASECRACTVVETVQKEGMYKCT